MSWSAKQYVTFEDERTRPVRDLVAAIPTREVRAAVDLGCGPGNSTEVLAARFPGAVVGGMDSSADMIAAARQRLPHIAFALGDIATWDDPAAPDVILSNAVLQWLPDHATLMREVAADGPWAAKLAHAAGKRAAMGTASWYFGLLRPHCSAVEVWRTTYHHPLAGGAAAVVEWFKGSGLRPFLAPLDAAERAAYLERYEAAVAQAYPAFDDGTVLLPFPRLFIMAVR